MKDWQHFFLAYLIFILMAASEVVMKLPFWIQRGCPLILLPWVFKMPLLALYLIYVFIMLSAKQSQEVKNEDE